MVALAGRGGRGRRLDGTLLAGTWPDRSIRCVAPAKTHRNSSIPRLLTAMARSDLVCARAVHMLDFSVAEYSRVEDPGRVIHLHLKMRAHDHFFGTRACRVDSAWTGARAWAGGRAHVAALEVKYRGSQCTRVLCAWHAVWQGWR